MTRSVPWGRNSKGDPVYTNGIMENALGLTPYIGGWAKDTGYYVRPDTRDRVIAIIESIDWDRVCRVVNNFDTPFNPGDRPGMRFDGRLLVTPRRYDKLLQGCLRKVSKVEFNRLVSSAAKGKESKK